MEVYRLEGYTFGKKDALKVRDNSIPGLLKRLEAKYAVEGMRRTVFGVLVVHEHNFPHILMLRRPETDQFQLPGGRLRAGEGIQEGLKRKLTNKLAPPGQQPTWEIGEQLATWYRPNFEEFLYPYLPAHITKPKEVQRVFAVQMPKNAKFAIPKNFELLAVPLFDAYTNVPRFGRQLSTVPDLLSRLQITYVGAEDQGKDSASSQNPSDLAGNKDEEKVDGESPEGRGRNQEGKEATQGDEEAADVVMTPVTPADQNGEGE